MSATGTLTANYGSFFKWNARLSVLPYTATYNVFTSHPNGTASDALGEILGLMTCLIATPFLLPATVCTFSLALAISHFFVSLAPIAYTGTLIADGLSIFAEDQNTMAIV